ncbi:MAG: hypothetical protein ACLSAP_08790 [Oscillospiraceae bacterium]
MAGGCGGRAVAGAAAVADVAVAGAAVAAGAAVWVCGAAAADGLSGHSTAAEPLCFAVIQLQQLSLSLGQFLHDWSEFDSPHFLHKILSYTCAE